MTSKRAGETNLIKANADTRLGSARVRLLPDSAEDAAAGFENPQATELIDPSELPDAIRNLGIGVRRNVDADATMTFDPKELLGDDGPLDPHDRTMIAPGIGETLSEKSSKEAGFESPLNPLAPPAATDILSLDHTLESGGVSDDDDFPLPPMTRPDEHSGDQAVIPSVPAPPPAGQRPSWLGSAKPVDLGRPQSVGPSPFEDEKLSLPTGAFGPIDPAAAHPDVVAEKKSGCGPLGIGALLLGLVAAGGGVAFALGVFDPAAPAPDPSVAATEMADGEPAESAVESVANIESPVTEDLGNGGVNDDTAGGDAGKGSVPEGANQVVAIAATVVPPAALPADAGIVAVDAVDTVDGTDGVVPETDAKAAPVGFVRVLDNSGSKLPELAEALQQSVLRALGTTPRVNAKPGPVKFGFLVELRLQTLVFPPADQAETSRSKVEASCSLVIRPTPLGDAEVETRNAHATVDSPNGDAPNVKSAIATKAIAACADALAADLVDFVDEHPLDWTADKGEVTKDKSKRKRTKRPKRKRRRRSK